MTFAEIKEILIEQVPRADLMKIDKNGLLYVTFVKDESKQIWKKVAVYFVAPFSAIGDKSFGTSEKSSFLMPFLAQTNNDEA